MKYFSFVFILMFICSLSFLTGCKPKVPKIGILMPDYNSERWIKEKRFLVENLTKRGSEVLVESANNDQIQQNSQAKEMMAKGVDVLIVIPVDQDESARIVEIAHESNVKVIAYARLINGCKLDYFVSVDMAHNGELQATSLTSLKPKGNYALIGGAKTDNNSMKMFIGQMNVFQPLMESGDVELVYGEFGEWSKEDGYRQAKIIIDKYADGLTGIVCGDDNLAMGALMALKENRLEGKVLLAGHDADLLNLKEIIRGNQTSTILLPLKEMAQVTAELAVSLALEKPLKMKFTTESNGKALVKSILIDAIVVNKNNIESTVIASGFHSSSELNN